MKLISLHFGLIIAFIIHIQTQLTCYLTYGFLVWFHPYLQQQAHYLMSKINLFSRNRQKHFLCCHLFFLCRFMPNCLHFSWKFFNFASTSAFLAGSQRMDAASSIIVFAFFTELCRHMRHHIMMRKLYAVLVYKHLYNPFTSASSKVILLSFKFLFICSM